MLNKILKNRNIFLVFLFILIIPAYIFLLKPGLYWNMHDDMQMIRQLQMEKCLIDGQIPCRWTPDVGYGYGLPLFNYYPPLPYIIGQVFRFNGTSFASAVKYTAVLQIILSAYFMYLLVSSIFGKIGGLLSALFYTYAPYHAVNIYVRGAMNEAWAAVFFPLTFLYVKKLLETNKIKYLVGLSISLSCLLLSHNPMVLIFSPLLILWSIYWMYYLKKFTPANIIPVISKLLFSALLALGLSSFFTIPALFETKLIGIGKMFTGYYSYYNHFVSLRQLFISNFWGDGGSIWGPNDGMSFSVGYLHWIIPLVILIALFIKTINKQKLTRLEYFIIGLVAISFLTLFMAHERSTFLWKLLTPLQIIQFPWRFLNISNFLLSLSIGYLPLTVIKKKQFKLKNYILFSSLIILLLAINIKYFTPVTYGPVTDKQKFSGQAWLNQISGGINDYLPISASNPPSNIARDFVDDIIPTDTDYQIFGTKKGTNWQFFNIKLNKPANILLPIIYYPNYDINVDGKSTKFTTEPVRGRISLRLDAGQHQVYVKLHDTPLRKLANIITYISYIILGYLLIKPLWTKSI